MSISKGYSKAVSSLLIMLFVAGILVGGLSIFYFGMNENDSLQEQISQLQAQISSLSGNSSNIYQNITIYQNQTYLADLYDEVKDSIVLVQGQTSGGSVQGSGFVYLYSQRNVVITNNHVVEDATDLSVTFQNGHGYSATVLGTDPYADLAVLSVNVGDADELRPLKIASSSSLRVGEEVIAIGNPYGLVGSLTTGVISALGRSITEDSTSRFSIANIIQTSVSINPGNSGGPLLNAAGEVIGVTTAILSDSQGLAFAIPSNTILREIYALITTGTYTGHSYLGVNGNDMSYQVAQETGASVTYGWRLAAIVRGGPSDGHLQVNDIIVALNGVTIRNNDDLASYLEEYTLPGQTIRVSVIRGDNNQHLDVEFILGTRPPPT